MLGGGPSVMPCGWSWDHAHTIVLAMTKMKGATQREIMTQESVEGMHLGSHDRSDDRFVPPSSHDLVNCKGVVSKRTMTKK